MNNEARYPRTAAAIRELDEGQSSIRILPRDPNDPVDGPTKADLRRPGLARLPSQKAAEDKVGRSEFSTSHDDSGSPDSQQDQFGNPSLLLGRESQDQEFGNPNLPAVQQQQQQQQQQQSQWGSSSAWDAIRGGGSKQADFWDRLRNQNAKQNDIAGQPRDDSGNSAQYEDLGDASDTNDRKRSGGSAFGT
ncbi:hypothetical protein H4R20_001485 [Coemansia guatemalensis]|uniref:Uncharacterized protein n=1 Tax=Coemansia guatemalensis TaxID=2761395 RepID=A0A9W8HXB2_9FUNG|nr:hypothetical protein H4R20_001485 [Coemansia guatemalensis]